MWKMDFEPGPSPNKSGKTDVFEKHFPDGELSDADFLELPDDVQERLEQLGMLYQDVDSYTPGRFHDVRKIEIGPGDAIYVARKNKEYTDSVTEVTTSEECTYVVDYRDGEIAGYSEIRLAPNDDRAYFKDKPFVGFTETEKKYRRAGLAERRLRLMNALGMQRYGKPIHSDTLISDEARALWDKLVERGEARKFKEGKHDRYVFEGP